MPLPLQRCAPGSLPPALSFNSIGTVSRPFGKAVSSRGIRCLRQPASTQWPIPLSCAKARRKARRNPLRGRGRSTGGSEPIGQWPLSICEKATKVLAARILCMPSSRAGGTRMLDEAKQKRHFLPFCLAQRRTRRCAAPHCISSSCQAMRHTNAITAGPPPKRPVWARSN